MTFVKQLNRLFLFITTAAIILLIYSWYNSYQFDNNPLSYELRNNLAQKEHGIKKLIKKHYKIDLNIPLIVTNKMNSKQFGMATYDTRTNQIQIYLNKKRFKESERYMLRDVLPHEYAHALMFAFGDFSNQNSGHTLRWQQACKKLNGSRCDRFVNHDDILIDKTKLPF